MALSPTAALVTRYQEGVLEGRTVTESFLDARAKTTGAPCSNRFAARIAASLTARALREAGR